MKVFPVCFVITAALWPSFAVTVVVSVETVHDALSIPLSEVQAPVSLILYHFLLFRLNIEMYQTQNSAVSLNFSEIHHHRLKMLIFMLYSLPNFPLLSISSLLLLLFFLSFWIKDPDFLALPHILAFYQLYFKLLHPRECSQD